MPRIRPRRLVWLGMKNEHSYTAKKLNPLQWIVVKLFGYKEVNVR